MKEEISIVVGEMYDTAFEYNQSFEHSPASELSRFADRLSKILKENEEKKDE